MDRRRWLQHQCSERPTNRDLPCAASRRRNESAQREITFLSNKENSENRRWPTALHFDCFSMAAASTGDNGPRCQSPSVVHRHVIVSNGGVGGTGECYSQTQLPFRCVLA